MPEAPQRSEAQLRIARGVVLVTWIFAALSFFAPLAALPIAGLGRALFGLLFCVHLVEYAFFFRTYAAAGGSAFGHFLRHMVYGVIYKTEVEQQRARG